MSEKLQSIIDEKQIHNKIYFFRGKQVMLDSDLAVLYQVSTKRLNEQVSRNKNRFPKQFMFQLTIDEYNDLRSQIATSSEDVQHGGRRYMPFVFTEQGIAMLSAVLKSDHAVEVSIRIMESFVEMRRFLISNRELFARLERVELKQLESDKKLEEVFSYMSTYAEEKQHVFFEGQIYDAFSFIVNIIKKAETELILVDNYVDTNTLNFLCKKNKGVKVVVIGAGKGSLSSQDVDKFNAQYQSLIIRSTNDFHDRFLVVDDKIVYHIGASIKDAGNKCFGITEIEDKEMRDALITKIKMV